MNETALKKGSKKEKEEILDLIKAYEFAEDHILSEENLLKAHNLLAGKLLAKSRRGKYRKEPVGVFSSQGLEYMVLESDRLEMEMGLFLSEIGELLEKKMGREEAFFWSL